LPLGFQIPAHGKATPNNIDDQLSKGTDLKSDLGYLFNAY
ncbi:MAG: hypothetical protein RBG13Loki_3445, partial [Promethearchaeota archaeon CR_4]